MESKEVKQKYVAQYVTGSQYTEQNWEPIRPTLEITEETTIGEIVKWITGKSTHALPVHFEVWHVETLTP